eukprot:3495625-Pleurochrysis_carterae.AAC.1
MTHSRALAFSFLPLHTRPRRKFPESARANATFALRPDPARKRERELGPPALTAKRRLTV